MIVTPTSSSLNRVDWRMLESMVDEKMGYDLYGNYLDESR